MKFENKWHPLHEADRNSGRVVLPARRQDVVGDLTTCFMPAKRKDVTFFFKKNICYLFVFYYLIMNLLDYLLATNLLIYLPIYVFCFILGNKSDQLTTK